MSAKDGSDIVVDEKVGNRIMQNTYRMVLARHDEPRMDVTGHYWEIIEFYKIGEVRQLV